MFKTIVVSLAIGIFIGGVSVWCYMPTKGAQVDKIEQQNTDKTKTVTKVKRPDGTVETKTVVVDKSTKTISVVDKKKNKIDLGVSTDNIYKIHYERRIGQSDFWIGAYAQSDKQIGITLGLEF